jgi:hypothetical protein
LKLVQETGKTLEHIGLGSNFLGRTSIAQQLRETLGKWDYMKLKSFCTAKETVTRLKRQLTEWEKILASCTSDKIYKELQKTNLSKNQKPNEEMGK